MKNETITINPHMPITQFAQCPRCGEIHVEDIAPIGDNKAGAYELWRCWDCERNFLRLYVDYRISSDGIMRYKRLGKESE